MHIYPTSPREEPDKVPEPGPLMWVILRLMQRWCRKAGKTTSLDPIDEFRKAMLSHDTFEEGLMSLLGLDPSDVKAWAPYGLVCYLAVTPMSINWKAPFAGILSELNMGWRTDAGFTMPEALNEAQMELLHKYATCLRREGRGLEWSQLLPTDWFPSTSEADIEQVSIANLDVDTCRDNTHRGAKLPPLGFVLSCQQQQESLFRR
jgi:hypothetical protein